MCLVAKIYYLIISVKIYKIRFGQRREHQEQVQHHYITMGMWNKYEWSNS